MDLAMLFRILALETILNKSIASSKEHESLLHYADRDMNSSPFQKVISVEGETPKRSVVYYGDSHIVNQDITLQHFKNSKMYNESKSLINDESDLIDLESELGKLSNQDVRVSVISSVNEPAFEPEDSSDDGQYSSIFVKKNEIEMLHGKR